MDEAVATGSGYEELDHRIVLRGVFRGTVSIVIGTALSCSIASVLEGVKLVHPVSIADTVELSDAPHLLHS